MLAVKEALTNVLKHAAASEVRVSLSFVDEVLEVTIGDDGVGFDAKQVARGNGLDNLRQRLSEMGGGCTIESAIGGGTVVRLRLPLPHEEVIS
jgi:signal transduction histidine kinase